MRIFPGILLLLSIIVLSCGGHQRNMGLLSAARSNNTAVISQSIHEGADVDFQDKRGRTALYFAVCKGNKEAVELLLENDADTNTTGVFNPLEEAAARGYIEILTLLLDRSESADLQELVYRAITAQHKEDREEENLDIVVLLEKHGAKLGKKELEDAVVFRRQKTAEHILGKGVDLKKDSSRVFKSALDNVNELRGMDIFKTLLEHGVDLSSAGPNGKLLNQAAGRDNAEVVKILLKYGAVIDPPEPKRGMQSALCDAVDMGTPEIAKLLLEAGADVDPRCKFDKTPLHTAVDNSTFPKDEFIKILLKRGANTDTRHQDENVLERTARLGRPSYTDLIVTHLFEKTSEQNPLKRAYRKTTTEKTDRRAKATLQNLIVLIDYTNRLSTRLLADADERRLTADTAGADTCINLAAHLKDLVARIRNVFDKAATEIEQGTSGFSLQNNVIGVRDMVTKLMDELEQTVSSGSLEFSDKKTSAVITRMKSITHHMARNIEQIRSL